MSESVCYTYPIVSKKRPAPSPWEILLALLNKDIVSIVRDLLSVGEDIARFLTGLRPQGIYEVLEHYTTLELCDTAGKVARVTRQQTVRFLQDNVVAITDYAWGDGQTLAEYTCHPGVPVDVYDDGAKKTILISLRETKSRGDVLRFHIQRKIVAGFGKRHEWWESEAYHRIRRLRVAIIFPKGRPCQHATLAQRSRNNAIKLGKRHFCFLKDGRQRLTWEIRGPRLYDRYTIKWVW